MKFCNNCVFPDTKPDLTFNESGICSACEFSFKKNTDIDWDSRLSELKGIVSKYKSRSGNWDCIVPVSGGKDSTFQTWFVKEKLGLNPLCVHFEPTVRTELGQRNLNALRNMGVDLISWDKNPKVYKAMGLEAFKRVGDHEWPNHIGIFTVPVITAVKFNIPLIIWGENSQSEYGGPAAAQHAKVLNRRWLEEFGGLLGNRIYDMIGVDGITERDILPYLYPADEDLDRVGVTGLFLGHYVKWDARSQMEQISQLGWSKKDNGPVEGTYSDHENLDEATYYIHDYLKYVKFGFGRATDHAGIDIRNGRMTREDACRKVREYDGKYPKEHLKEFLKYYSLDKFQFDKVVDSYTNKKIFLRNLDGSFARDSEGNLVKLFHPETRIDSHSGFRVGESQVSSESI